MNERSHFSVFICGFVYMYVYTSRRTVPQYMHFRMISCNFTHVMSMTLITFKNIVVFTCYSSAWQYSGYKGWEWVGMCVWTCAFLLQSSATWVCQHLVYHSPWTCGGWGLGAADMTAHFKEIGQSDAGWKGTERPLYLPRAEPGKRQQPSPTLCPWLKPSGFTGNAQCCLSSGSVMCPKKTSLNNIPYISMKADADRWIV